MPVVYVVTVHLVLVLCNTIEFDNLFYSKNAPTNLAGASCYVANLIYGSTAAWPSSCRSFTTSLPAW